MVKRLEDFAAPTLDDKLDGVALFDAIRIKTGDDHKYLHKTTLFCECHEIDPGCFTPCEQCFIPPSVPAKKQYETQAQILYQPRSG